MLTKAGPAAWALVLLIASPAAATEDAYTVSGVVRTAAGRLLAGATVSLEGGDSQARTDAAGAYRLSVPAGERSLRVSHPGYESATLTLKVTSDLGGVDVTLAPLYQFREDVVVQAIRADETVPVTKRDIDREEIERLNQGQEMPFLLKQTPSLTQYSDTGLPAGYSYLYLRGIQQTRINMTLDGVPLNDPEDSAVYFVDFGDFASSLGSIQVQRGVGTSTVGAASYVGSINFASVELGDEPEVSGRLGMGSWGTGRASLALQSGRVGPGLAFYGRASYQQTDGFRDHSGVLQRSAFFGASHRGERSFVKVFGFAGREQTQLAFLATERDALESDLRRNPLSAEERDRFGESFVQGQYTRLLGSSSSLAAQAYWVGADGWYRIRGPEALLQYGLEWGFGGGALTFNHARGRTSFTFGVHANDFGSRHTRDVVGGEREYSNRGLKNEANAFAKLGYDLGRMKLYADAQLRWSRFRYEGELDLGSVEWTFFNPKLGARFDLTKHLSLYASVGRAEREPARADLLAGEDNATIPYDLRAVEPERALDFEAGLDYRRRGLWVKADLYAMQFRNEIALTGELSEIGLPLRRNVGRSHRRGLELDVAWQAFPKLKVQHTANLSRNRIAEWTQFYDVYAADGSYAGSASRTFRDAPPLLTPPLVANLGLDYAAASWLSVAAAARYVAEAHLDNTGDERFTTPDFFTLEATLSFGLGGFLKKGEPRIRILVDNALDNRRLFPSGYSYLFLVRTPDGTETAQGIPYYYPLATRSIFVTLEFRF